MLIGIINFDHFVLLSLTLTLPGGNKVNTKQNLLASFSNFFHTFHLIRMKSDAVMKQFKLNILSYVLVRFIKTMEITAVLQTASKIFHVRHGFGCL